MNYLDASALVKRYVKEDGSERVTAMVLREGPVATATIAYAEVFAAFARRHREGGISPRRYATLQRNFAREWPAHIRVALRDDVLVRARDLVRRHPLRAYDAVHLATALDLQVALGEPVTFVAADGRLLDAAARERLGVMNPEVAPSS